MRSSSVVLPFHLRVVTDTVSRLPMECRRHNRCDRVSESQYDASIL